MKRWIIAQVLIVFAVLVFGQFCKANFVDHGLYKMKTIDNAYSLECGIEYILGNDDSDEIRSFNNFVENQNMYIESMQNYPIVVIGKPTGNIEQAVRSFGQEIYVEKVLRGSGIEEKSNCYIYNSYGFNINNENKLVYCDWANVMNPESYYLIFMEASELNNLTSKDSYLSIGYFSYLNISKDRFVPINGDTDTLKFWDLRDNEFFASSQRIIDQVQIIKHKIVKKYKDEIGEYLGIEIN